MKKNEKLESVILEIQNYALSNVGNFTLTFENEEEWFNILFKGDFFYGTYADVEAEDFIEENNLEKQDMLEIIRNGKYSGEIINEDVTEDVVNIFFKTVGYDWFYNQNGKELISKSIRDNE